jgi:hypothetical protein
VVIPVEQGGPVTDLSSSIELRWRRLLRRGPFAVLALATAVSAGTMRLFDAGPVAWSLLLGGAAVIAVAHLLVVDRRWGATRPGTWPAGRRWRSC